MEFYDLTQLLPSQPNSGCRQKHLTANKGGIKLPHSIVLMYFSFVELRLRLTRRQSTAIEGFFKS